jgi:hypothetical protein
VCAKTLEGARVITFRWCESQPQVCAVELDHEIFLHFKTLSCAYSWMFEEIRQKLFLVVGSSSMYITNFTPNVTTKWLALPIHVWEVPVVRLAILTGVSLFSSVSPSKCWDSTLN